MTPEQFSKDRQPAHCGTDCGQCCSVAGTDRVVVMTHKEATHAALATGRPLPPSVPQKLRYSRNAPCPFLDGKRCSVYEVRPLGCRAYVCAGEIGKPFDQHPEFVDFYLQKVVEVDEGVFDVRGWFPEDIDDVIARHDRIALQFSGGKDSIATLEVMRPWLDKLTVYWLNTGDAFPEVVEVVDKVRGLVDNFVEIDGKLSTVIENYGMPSDLVSYSSAEVAHNIGVGSTQLLQSRFECCNRSIMRPLHDRMEDDGITLIVRGQRNEETLKGPYRSGDVEGSLEFLYPIEDWTSQQVFDYIVEKGWEIPRYYAEGVPHSGDCLTCTAWVGDGRARYLRKYHPEAFRRYRSKFATVAGAVRKSMTEIIKEAEDCYEPV
jgi:3'-phosphoadenosine 5'-phosphosulfate sulfotransferase (PAPS reductase)/FAD synthetase/Fe-S-cluster containining protein